MDQLVLVRKKTTHSVNDADIYPSTSSIRTRPVSSIPREKPNNSSKRNYGRLLNVQLHSSGNTKTIKEKFKMVYRYVDCIEKYMYVMNRCIKKVLPSREFPYCKDDNHDNYFNERRSERMKYDNSINISCNFGVTSYMEPSNSSSKYQTQGK